MLKELLSVKKIIAVMLTVVFCVLTIKGQVSSTEFLTVFTMIISFYFGHSATRQAMIDGKPQAGDLPQGDPELLESVNMNAQTGKPSTVNNQGAPKGGNSK